MLLVDPARTPARVEDGRRGLSSESCCGLLLHTYISGMRQQPDARRAQAVQLRDTYKLPRAREGKNRQFGPLFGAFKGSTHLLFLRLDLMDATSLIDLRELSCHESCRLLFCYATDIVIRIKSRRVSREVIPHTLYRESCSAVNVLDAWKRT